MGYNEFINEKQEPTKSTELSVTAQTLMTKIAACSKARKQTVKKIKQQTKTAALLLVTGTSKESPLVKKASVFDDIRVMLANKKSHEDLLQKQVQENQKIPDIIDQQKKLLEKNLRKEELKKAWGAYTQGGMANDIAGLSAGILAGGGTHWLTGKIKALKDRPLLRALASLGVGFGAAIPAANAMQIARERAAGKVTI